MLIFVTTSVVSRRIWGGGEVLTEKDHIYCNNGLVLRPDGFMSDWTHPITGKEYKNGADGGGILYVRPVSNR
jgi:hypothetical protein